MAEKQSKIGKLPKRPNLEHLRGQAKKVLAKLTREAGSSGKPKLADAQLVVARQAGFASWAKLVKHVEVLRGLEGEWRIERMEVDGEAAPQRALKDTRISIDGDRFRTDSPEGTYEGIFAIDTEKTHFDLRFIAGPDAGNTVLGRYRLDAQDELVLCLGLAGAPRPKELASPRNSGLVLEHLRRVSSARPANVDGGSAPTAEAEPPNVPRGDAATFGAAKSELLERLAGTWAALELVNDGKAMPADWLNHGKRTMRGNHVTVLFGKQTLVDAKVRFDETVNPVAVDYLHASGKNEGKVSLGILAFQGDSVCFVMAAPGRPRPTTFEPPLKGTLSRWRRVK